MSVQITTTEGYGSRIGNSLKGILFGLAAIAGSVFLLFFNEGRAVKTAEALNEGQGIVQCLTDTTKIDPAMEGKLVHLTGTATTQDELKDGTFGLTYQGMRLVRKVQFYQWQEIEHTTEEEHTGGKTTRTTTYSYEKGWVDNPILSGNFKEAGHKNTVCMNNLHSERWFAKNVRLGAFRLNTSQIERISNTTPYSLAQFRAPKGLPANSKVNGEELYLTERNSIPNPQRPQIGDIRVTWSVVSPKEDVSLVAVQFRDTFEPYVAKSSGYQVDLFSCGTKSSDEMFRSAHEDNNMLTWVWRFAGWFIMLVGFVKLFRPISVLASILPFLGHVFEAGALIVAFFLSAVGSLVVIGIAWLTYRPVVGVLVLAAAAGVLFWFLFGRKGKAPKKD